MGMGRRASEIGNGTFWPKYIFLVYLINVFFANHNFDIFIAFVILVGGWIISLLVLIGELFFHKFWQKY